MVANTVLTSRAPNVVFMECEKFISSTVRCLEQLVLRTVRILYVFFFFSDKKTEKLHFSKILINPKDAVLIRAAICTGWNAAEVRRPQNAVW